MINYLFSGIDKEKGFTINQSKYLKEDIIPNSNITFIASTFENYQKNDSYLSNYIKFFNNIDITFKKVNLIDNRTTKVESRKIIENSDIIFLLGGNPELQMKSINEYEITECIKKCKIILGVSAGAMNQSNRVMYKDDFDNFIMKDYHGLGVASVNIFPHFELDNKSILDETKEISNTLRWRRSLS